LEAPPLKLIKKSEIIKHENVMEDFEWHFIDSTQLSKVVGWLKMKITQDNQQLAKDYELKQFGAETNHFIDMFYKNTMKYIDEAFPNLPTFPEEKEINTG